MLPCRRARRSLLQTKRDGVPYPCLAPHSVQVVGMGSKSTGWHGWLGGWVAGKVLPRPCTAVDARPAGWPGPAWPCTICPLKHITTCQPSQAASKERASRPLCPAARLPSWRLAWCPTRRPTRCGKLSVRLFYCNAIAEGSWLQLAAATCNPAPPCLSPQPAGPATCRPQIEALIRSHVEAHLPPATNVTIRALGFRAHPYTQVGAPLRQALQLPPE